MFNLSVLCLGALVRLFRSRGNHVVENLVLRQQLAVLKRRRPWLGLNIFEKLFWVTVRGCGQNLNRLSSSPRLKTGPVAPS